MEKEILAVKNLKKYFFFNSGSFFKKKRIVIKAVDNVNFSINKGETLGVVGETGCGKTTLGRTIVKLYGPDDGEIILKGINITKLNDLEMKPMRKIIQMIFQDPYLSLDARMTAGEIIAEPMRIHKLYENEKELNERVNELLGLVGLNEEHKIRYPHEFSGGQRQRIGIARSLAVNPEIIICDEPVSALDVSIQAQIINLFEDLQEKFGLTYIFISHDLSMVKHISTRVAVMYFGKIIELANSLDLYKNPIHPYTKALISAVPLPDPKLERKRERIILPKDIGEESGISAGCRFIGRCNISKEICKESEPPLIDKGDSHFVSCHNL